MEKHLIYKHTFPNDKVYIGQCLGETIKNAIYRWGKNGNNYKGQLVYRAIQKYGWDNIQHEILEVVETQKEANEKEIYYISLYNSTNKANGYNVSIGGSSNNMGKNSGSKEYMKEYMMLNGDRYKDHHNEYMRKYRMEHNEELKERYKERYKGKYKDKQKSYDKKSYLKNREKRLEYQRKYYEEHKKRCE